MIVLLNRIRFLLFLAVLPYSTTVGLASCSILMVIVISQISHGILGKLFQCLLWAFQILQILFSTSLQCSFPLFSFPVLNLAAVLKCLYNKYFKVCLLSLFFYTRGYNLIFLYSLLHLNISTALYQFLFYWHCCCFSINI